MTTDKIPASLAVDVLAVMDELIDFEERHAEYEPRQNHEAREARAAVAELIDIGSRINWYSHEGVFAAFHAALARVKGESA